MLRRCGKVHPSAGRCLRLRAARVPCRSPDAVLLSLSQPAYHALGSAPPPQSANVIAMFRADTTEHEMRKLLRANGATLVGGPTSADAYLLRVPAVSRATVLAKLRSDRHVHHRPADRRGSVMTVSVACFACCACNRGAGCCACRRLRRASPGIPPERQILVMVRHPRRPFPAERRLWRRRLWRRSCAEARASGSPEAIARDHRLTFLDGWPMPMIGVDCFIMAVPDGRSTIGGRAELSHDSKVAWAEPVELFRRRAAARTPTIRSFAAQPAAHQWQLADLHRIATGRGVKVAVIDSGIEASHPDLAGQLIVNRNFVAGQSKCAEDHGTGVAGIIAAKADNGIGIAGVAPDARLLGLRACWQQRTTATVCDGLSLAKALYFAVEQHADVINLSLSGPDDRLLRDALDVALDARHRSSCPAYDPKQAGRRFPGLGAGRDRRFRPQLCSAFGAASTLRPGGTSRRRSREDDGFSSMEAPLPLRMSAGLPRWCGSGGARPD